MLSISPALLLDFIRQRLQVLWLERHLAATDRLQQTVDRVLAREYGALEKWLARVVEQQQSAQVAGERQTAVAVAVVVDEEREEAAS